MKKMSALAGARAGRIAATRKALVQLLQHVVQLAGNLQAEGRSLPPFAMPEKSARALRRAGRQFAVDVAPFDADFAGHGLGVAQIGRTTAMFEAAVNDKG